MGRLTGVRFEGADEGTAAFSLPVSRWFEWSHGSVPGGVLALAADAALGCALQSLLPSHTQYTTAEMSMTYLRPARIGSVVTAHGRALHAGATLGLSAGEVIDGKGRLVGYYTSRLRIFGETAAGAPTRGGTAAPPARASGTNGADGNSTRTSGPCPASVSTSPCFSSAAASRSSTRRSAVTCRCRRCIICWASPRPKRPSAPPRVRCR